MTDTLKTRTFDRGTSQRRFPTGRWVLVEVIEDGHVKRYGTAWLSTYRGNIPVIARDQKPDAPQVTLFSASGRIISAHSSPESPMARAAYLNRELEVFRAGAC